MPFFNAANQWLSNISGQTPINTQVPVNEKKNKGVEKMMRDYYLMADQEVESKRRNDNRGGRGKTFHNNSNNYNARRNDAHHQRPLSKSFVQKVPGHGKKDKLKKTTSNRIRVGNKSYLS